MVKEVGSRDFPIWLLGDSNPKNWSENLQSPLDPRHRARHNIWTPIINTIQEQVYRASGLRVDTSDLYIRNAIENPSEKPKSTDTAWENINVNAYQKLSVLIHKYKPAFIFCFGAFSYEFYRRSMGQTPVHHEKYWTTKRLGDMFRSQISNFNVHQSNVFSLLHLSIARGKFIVSHDHYCGLKDANYFQYTGSEIAKLFLQNKEILNIWI